MNNTFLDTTSGAQGAFMGRRLWAAIGFGLLVFLAACSSAPAVGTLQVNITGLPSGVNASVKVTGTGFTQDLTASTPLSNRAVGSYTVTADNVTSGGQTFIGTVTGSPATVTANTTSTVTVTYAVSPTNLGTLQVNLVVPGGGNGNVSISGPNSFSRTITATTTLSGLVPGAYTLTAINVPGVGTSADLILAGTVSGTSTVEANKTATATVTYAATTGTIKLTVEGLPAGVEADIVVTRGDNGFQQTVTATTTLTGLAPNNYSITVRNVRASGAIVDTAFVSSSSDELSVDAGQVRTTVVTYTERPATGSLWVPVLDSVFRLLASRLIGGAPIPIGPITQAGSNQAVVFDANGNMYVSSGTANSISRYTPDQLGALGTQTPVTLTSTGLINPIGMAFDSLGNLWVANPATIGSTTGDRVVSFTPAQLTAGGFQTPDKTLTSGNFSDPVGLAFDTAGNLWVSNANSASGLVRFTPTQLTVAGPQSPNPIVSSTSFARPSQIAFDANGNLWVANQNGTDTQGLVISFIPAQLEAGSSQNPTVRLIGSALTQPTGLAFDNGGNLWVFRLGGNLVQITAANLATSGSPTAAKGVSGLGSPSGGYLAFSPTPSNLPIQNK